MRYVNFLVGKSLYDFTDKNSGRIRNIMDDEYLNEYGEIEKSYEELLIESPPINLTFFYRNMPDQHYFRLDNGGYFDYQDKVKLTIKEMIFRIDSYLKKNRKIKS